jgi:hypothetical protein
VRVRCELRAARHDHGDAPADEVSRQLRQLIQLIVGEAVFDRDVLTST